MTVEDKCFSAKTLGNILHYGISFGTTWVVFLVFWPLYLFNQELILPKRNEVFYPYWMNLVEHGLIAPFALINCLLEKRSANRFAYGLALVTFATGSLIFERSNQNVCWERIFYFSQILITLFIRNENQTEDKKVFNFDN